MQIFQPRKTAVFAMVAMAGALTLPLAQAQPPAKPDAAMPGMSSSASMPGGGMDMKVIMKDMNDKMSAMQMTGKQDVDFAMMMRMHHQAAIAMAETEIASGKEPQMKKMAKKIISSQKKEIAEIDRFLAKHGQEPAMKK